MVIINIVIFIEALVNYLAVLAVNNRNHGDILHDMVDMFIKKNGIIYALMANIVVKLLSIISKLKTVWVLNCSIRSLYKTKSF